MKYYIMEHVNEQNVTSNIALNLLGFFLFLHISFRFSHMTFLYTRR